MKMAAKTVIAFTLSLILSSFTNSHRETYSLIVEVSNLRNEK